MDVNLFVMIDACVYVRCFYKRAVYDRSMFDYVSKLNVLFIYLKITYMCGQYF